MCRDLLRGLVPHDWGEAGAMGHAGTASGDTESWREETGELESRFSGLKCGLEQRCGQIMCSDWDVL